MNLKDRQKICRQCDGRIPLEAHHCPYCSTEQSGMVSMEEDSQFYRQQSLQNSLTSLYSPPYSVKHSTYTHSGKTEDSSFMKQTDQFKDVAPDKRFQSSEEQTSFWPILFLSMGANLLLLGFLQLFFSENGFLRLEWETNNWFIYCLLALPLIGFGYKKAKELK
jgi:hypothetical protein